MNLRALSCEVVLWSISRTMAISKMHSLTSLSLDSMDFATIDISSKSSLTMLTSLKCTEFQNPQVPGLEGAVAGCKVLQHLIIDGCEGLIDPVPLQGLRTLHIGYLLLGVGKLCESQAEIALRGHYVAQYDFRIDTLQVQGTFTQSASILQDIARLRHLPRPKILSVSGQMLQLGAFTGLTKLVLKNLVLAPTSLHEAAGATNGVPSFCIACDAKSLVDVLSHCHPISAASKLYIDVLSCNSGLKLNIYTHDVSTFELEDLRAFVDGWEQAEVNTNTRDACIHFDEVLANSVEFTDSDDDEGSEVGSSEEGLETIQS
eukprot:148124-Pelagomonas_calceolata.AAC.15